jgi:hypothetical protein
MLSAERFAAESKYSGRMYYQYEPEWSWKRPGIRAFGRVNGGLVFESCYMIDKQSVPLLSVFYADKAHTCCVKERRVNTLVNNTFFIFLIRTLYCILYIILHIFHIVHI